MILRRSTARTTVGLLLLLLTACSDNAAPAGTAIGSSDAGPTRGTPPGRPSATACSPSAETTTSTRLSDAGGFGPCVTNSDCTTGGIASLQGKCVANPDGGASECNYDQCLVDSDCGSTGVCQCAALFRSPVGSNVCLAGNCRIDSDCGDHGPCSPTVTAGCGRGFGIEGYYCHTASDDCATDADCGNTDGAYAPYCAYDTTVARWVCGSGVCAG